MPRLKKDNEGGELSLYDDSPPTDEELEMAMNRLSIAFPKMTKEFFLLLTEFVLNEKFTGKRLSDAVNHIIATFSYKELNISDIIQYDKRVKLYTYDYVSRLVTKGEASFSDFETREISGINYRVRKTDFG